MISKEIATKVLEKCLITGADFAEIFEEDTLNNSISILNGKVENPRIQTVKQIAKALNVTIDEIVNMD